MNIELLTVGSFCVNCAILWGDSPHAYIIDPGSDVDKIATRLAANNLTPAAYLLTHGHADHIHALAALHAKHPAPIYLHTADERWAFGPQNEIPSHYDVPQKPADTLLHPEIPTDWERLSPLFNSAKNQPATPRIQCIETPGHTPGGVCYWFQDENVCFTGDTLFKGSCGRTDLPGGNARILANSLKKLAILPPETRIIAGHGDQSTLAHELKTNFFMQSPSMK